MGIKQLSKELYLLKRKNEYSQKDMEHLKNIITEVLKVQETSLLAENTSEINTYSQAINRLIAFQKWPVDNAMPENWQIKQALTTILALPALPALDGLSFNHYQSLIEQEDADENDPMTNQGWYIRRMSAVGYKTDDGGMCFGMANMTMQCFLQDEMQQLNVRLKEIKERPLTDFYNDFENIYAEIKTLNPEKDKNKIDQLKAFIHDTTAFFDGIAITFAPDVYPELFEKTDGSSLSQNIELTLPLTMLANDEQKSAEPSSKQPYKPTQVDVLIGSYTQDDLTSYLQTLQEGLSQNCALVLSCNNHAINLNLKALTNPTKNVWLLTDPNDLNVKTFDNPRELAQALEDGFEPSKGLNKDEYKGRVIASEIYTQQQYCDEIKTQLTDLQKLPNFYAMHNGSTASVTYGKATPLYYAIGYNKVDWLNSALETMSDEEKRNFVNAPCFEDKFFPLSQALNKNKLDIAKILVEAGAEINFPLFFSAIEKENPAVIAFLTKQAPVKALALLTDYCSNGETKDFLKKIELLFNSGVLPTFAIYEEYKDSQPDLAKIIIKAMCENQCLNELKNLFNSGFPATLAMYETYKKSKPAVANVIIQAMCVNNNLEEVKNLIDNGAGVTLEMVAAANENSHTELAVFLAEKLEFEFDALSAIVSSVQNQNLTCSASLIRNRLTAPREEINDVFFKKLIHHLNESTFAFKDVQTLNAFIKSLPEGVYQSKIVQTLIQNPRHQAMLKWENMSERLHIMTNHFAKIETMHGGDKGHIQNKKTVLSLLSQLEQHQNALTELGTSFEKKESKNENIIADLDNLEKLIYSDEQLLRAIDVTNRFDLTPKSDTKEIKFCHILQENIVQKDDSTIEKQVQNDDFMASAVAFYRLHPNKLSQEFFKTLYDSPSDRQDVYQKYEESQHHVTTEFEDIACKLQVMKTGLQLENLRTPANHIKAQKINDFLTQLSTLESQLAEDMAKPELKNLFEAISKLSLDIAKSTSIDYVSITKSTSRLEINFSSLKDQLAEIKIPCATNDEHIENKDLQTENDISMPPASYHRTSG